MSNTINKKKFSTGWLIVVACMLIQAIPFGVASNIHLLVMLLKKMDSHLLDSH